MSLERRRSDDQVRCRLWRAEQTDAPKIARWLSEPANVRYLTSNLRNATLNAGLVNAALRRPDQAWYLFAPELGSAKADQSAVGILAVDSIDVIDGIGNLWYVLGDQSRAGRGLATAAILRFVENNPLKLHCVTAWLGAPNLASARCLEKAGFQKVGRIAEAFMVEGARHDRLMFQRILAHD